MKKEIEILNENKYEKYNNRYTYESPEDLIECFDDDVCNMMGRYVNMESFFNNKEIEEKFDYYINGLKGLILDENKVKWEHTTKIGGNGKEYQSIEIVDDKSMSKEEKEKWNNYLDDEMKLAEDNANADLEAQDYDVFGENKI